MDTSTPYPITIPRSEHNVSRSNISEYALKVLYRLRASGYEAYLVGGGVRDLLLGREPKDFDVVTDARPEQVREVFRNCRLIGRRFRLAHVHFGAEYIEVATFRGSATNDDNSDHQTEDGMILRDNVYGTIEEDAVRRDFTINALYYNIEDFSVLDYAAGVEDLRNGVLRLMGEPEQRYREDPVRMLRAVRFAAKLGFVIAPESERPMFELGDLLNAVPPARLFEEVLKLFMSGTGLHAFEKLRHYDLFGHLFPATESALAVQEHEFPLTFVNKGLHNTDLRVREGKPVTPAFLFAVLLWEPVRLRAAELEALEGLPPIPALQVAGEEIVSGQQFHISVPRRFSMPMKEIWSLQPRFHHRQGQRPLRLVGHPRFRAAYDFLLLRAEAGEVDPDLAEWWTRLQEAEEGERKQLTHARNGTGKPRRRRRRPRRDASKGND